MRLLTGYALGRLAFGAAALAAPATTGRLLAGPGGATPDAQAFLRGMGGREIGLATGLLLAVRGGASARPWLLAGVLFDGGDIAGIAGAWHDMQPAKRGPGIAFAGAAALAGAVLLVRAEVDTR
jgi:hypothetical protein